MRKRVVITGLGMITPLGNDVESSWQKMLDGQSGISMIESFDTTNFPVKFGGSIHGFDITEYVSTKDARKMDPSIHLGIAAASQAIVDSGLEINDNNAHRVGTLMSTGIGGIESIEKYANVLHKQGAKKISPFFVPMSINNMISGNLSIKFGLKGPNLCIVTACASGTHSIGSSVRMIQAGDADVMVCGGSEHGLTPLGLAGFSAAKALSTRNDTPTAASRPWDKGRDGFVLSDGAGAMVVEEYEHAKKRNAPIIAEITGFGMSGDAYHMTLPAQDASGASACMRNALRDAEINPEDIDYINAHGTSTPAGDKAENLSIKNVFGEHAYKLAVSSTKSMIGHSLGAAGAIEGVVCALAIRDQVLPPTINLDDPDPECDLNYIPHQAVKTQVSHVLSNSFGFGGTNGCILLKKI